MEETFEPQVFQPFVMFFGMLFALPMYLALEARKRIRARSDPALRAELDAAPPITVRHLLALGLPSIFDLISVVLLVSGLMHVPASMWMLLRGGCIVFVALMKQYVLHDELKPHMWAGVIIIALAVCLVGASPMIDDKEDDASEGGGGDDQLAFGLALTIGGTFMQSLQYVYEEKMMSGDTKAPPWLLIGMEGFFGTILSVCVVYPLAIYMPGSDHGSIESLENTITMLNNNPLLMQLSVVFCITVFILNSFSVLVTFMLSSVWHAILDNFRPITIWATQLAIYSLSGGVHGEKWSRGSYLQVSTYTSKYVVSTWVRGPSVAEPCSVRDVARDTSLLTSLPTYVYLLTTRSCSASLSCSTAPRSTTAPSRCPASSLRRTTCWPRAIRWPPPPSRDRPS